MHLVLHQLRQDLVQFRLLSLAWLGLLCLDLGVSLGWLGRPHFNEAGHPHPLALLWTDWLPAALVGLHALLAGGVVLADSPGKSDRFLATRPLPSRDLWLGKSAFLLLVLVVPATLQEGIHLALRGVPAGGIARAALERIVWVALGTVVVASAAALASNVRQAVGLATLTLVSILLGGIAAILSSMALSAYRGGTTTDIDDLTVSHVFLGLVLLGAALAALAGVANYRRWPASRRGAGAAGVGFLIAWFAKGANWDLFPIRAAAPDQARRELADGRVTVPLPRLIITPAVNDDSGRTTGARYAVGAVPQAEGLAPDEAVVWSSADSAVRLADGSAIPLRDRGPRQTRFTYRPMASVPEVAAFASLFPPGTRWAIAGQGVMMSDTSAYINAGSFTATPVAVGGSDRVRLELGIHGDLYRWERELELPLVEGSTRVSDAGEWTVVKLSAPGSLRSTIVLRYRALTLDFSSDPRRRETSFWPSGQFEFAIYQPAQGTVHLPTFRYVSARGAAHTAYPDRYLSVYFSDSPSRGTTLLPGESSDSLVILRRAYLGSSVATWASPEFRLPSGARRAGAEDVPAAVHPARSSRDIRAQLDALRTPPASAPRDAVGRYLLEVLDLVGVDAPGARRVRDTAAERLAPFVAEHLGLFIEGAAAANADGREVCVSAITRGALPDQRQEVIREWPRAPDLAGVLLARGWLGESRTELAELLQAPGPLPMGVLRAAAWLGDPGSSPRLIQELEASWDPSLYELLRTLPAIQPALDAAVHRRWRSKGGQVPAPWRPDWEVFLRHGIADALRALLATLGDTLATRPPEGAPADSWLPCLRAVVAADDLAPAERHDDLVFGRWLAEHRAAPFAFDSVRRQYVIPTREEDVP